jgi:hypothetical protein
VKRWATRLRECPGTSFAGFFRRLACVARGHFWRTVADTGGSITWCAHCGHQWHSRSVRADIHYRTHVNLAYEIEMQEGPPDHAFGHRGTHAPSTDPSCGCEAPIGASAA